MVIVDPLVRVAGDEHVVVTGGDHSPQHFPVSGAQVLSLVDDDVLVAVLQVAYRCLGVAMDQIATTDLL